MHGGGEMLKPGTKVFTRIWKDEIVWGRLGGEHAFVMLSDRHGICCQYNLAVTPILAGCTVEQLFVPNKDQDAPVPNWERCAQDPKGNWQLTKYFENHVSKWEEVKRYPTFCGAFLAAGTDLSLPGANLTGFEIKYIPKEVAQCPR